MAVNIRFIAIRCNGNMVNITFIQLLCATLKKRNNMRNKLTIGLLIILIGLISCEKDNDNQPDDFVSL